MPSVLWARGRQGSKKWRASLDRDRQRIAMKRDQGAQVRADRSRRLESGCFGSRLRVGGREVAALGVVFQVAVTADGEDVPRRALVAYEDQILRQFQCVGVGILHLALLDQFCMFAGKCLEHFYVEESGPVA